MLVKYYYYLFWLPYYVGEEDGNGFVFLEFGYVGGFEEVVVVFFGFYWRGVDLVY